MALERRVRGILTFCQKSAPMFPLLLRHGFVTNPFGRGPASGRIPVCVYGQSSNVPAFRSPDVWRIDPLDHDSY